MFKEEDPLLSRPSMLPLDGGTLGPVGLQPRTDRGFHVREESMVDEQSLGFHLPPYPSTFSSSCPSMSYHEDYCSKPDAAVEEPSGSRAAISEGHPSFENLELGFTELLPPLYPRGPPPPSPSPSPWLDSPYLSSSPSPSHSSSLSPFPAGSPISTSPLPPISASPYPQYSAYPQEACASPPSNPSPFQDMYPAAYSHYDGWEPQGKLLGTEHGPLRDAKIQECPLEFSSSASMHHITFEEGELNVCLI